MDEGFELPVHYNGKELLFPAKFVRFGYSYRIEVNVNGTTVSFEKDEQREWRAIEPSDSQTSNTFNKELLLAIAASMD